ncbi:BIG/ATPase V1 complex, subunit S1 [Cercophora scortea]|uniref:Protein BIG1 n=1 Tax=Cercophora scortea TaxID=314031 RepID=A0AAE0IN92_9PEZI|nr:BIG/ATPase V1 complex, subunit S1 [Cercophora scortea]
MQLSIATALLACTAVRAFSDSSPFVLFSTAELAPTPNDAQLQTSVQAIASAKEALSSCPTTRYIIVSQPNVHAADLRDSSGAGCNMHNLCRAIASDSVKGRFSVAEVIGQISSEPMKQFLTTNCKEKGKTAIIERVELRHLPPVKEESKRAEILADNDHELGQLFETLSGEYTVILVSDPNEFKAYEPEFAEPVHMDLKRQSSDSPVFVGRRADDATDNRPLFEKYQFFTPGIFTALLALIIILSILTVGLKALASLEVSYGAFDKENGPAAQKKQM